MVMIKWPNKTRRQELELMRFVELYRKLPHGQKLELIVADRERPDCIVKAKPGNQEFGVELTSVYMSNTSVPNHHLKNASECATFKLDESLIPVYQKRMAEKVQEKKELGKSYDLSRPLLLSVFANDHMSLEMGKSDWLVLPKIFPDVFLDIAPFKEIVFWSMADGHVLSVQSGGISIFV